MANTNAPFGFRPIGRQDGGAPTGGQETALISSGDTNLYFTGNPVTVSSGYLGLYDGSSNAVICAGIFNGCEYYNTNVQRQVWSPWSPGSVAATAYLITDPEQKFLVQSSSTPVTQASVGENVNVLTTQSSLGNQTSGISVCVIASTQITNSATLAFRIVDLYSNVAPTGAGGTDNTANYNLVVVAPNHWKRKAGIVSS